MDPEEMRRLLRRMPFVPFTIAMNNGESYPVEQHGFVLMSEDTIYLYPKPGLDGEYVTEEPTLCAVLNIATVTPLIEGAVIAN